MSMKVTYAQSTPVMINVTNINFFLPNQSMNTRVNKLANAAMLVIMRNAR